MAGRFGQTPIEPAASWRVPSIECTGGRAALFSMMKKYNSGLGRNKFNPDHSSLAAFHLNAGVLTFGALWAPHGECDATTDLQANFNARLTPPHISHQIQFLFSPKRPAHSSVITIMSSRGRRFRKSRDVVQCRGRCSPCRHSLHL